jgi:hypothetical protein
MDKKKICNSVAILFLTMLVILPAYQASAADINATVSAGIFVPGVPVNLAATVGDRSIELSWSAPDSNGGSVITDYVIEYKLTSGGVWSVFVDGVDTGTSKTVINLSNDNSYDFRVSAVNTIGQGSPSSPVSATPGSPAQVLIQSFGDLTVPSISTAVRLTNDGSTAYEYQYTWCVTNSDVNLCGGGDDVFSSTAAILIDPHLNFDTTLNSTVPTAGNYWFHLNVQFGSDSSHANQSFTAIAEPTVIPPSGGGGGGGGGGGSSPSVTEPIVPSSCNGADFNGDGKVSSIDFSILLAFWKTSPPFRNPCVDINSDGQVSSVDFSILLYQWGNRPTPFR